MKATGEVMSICTNFEGALMKALRSLEQHVDSLEGSAYKGNTTEEIEEMLHIVDDRRIFVVAEAVRRGIPYQKIHEITMIDEWFIDKIAILVEMEDSLKNAKELDKELLYEAKRLEFPDCVIAGWTGRKIGRAHV